MRRIDCVSIHGQIHEDTLKMKCTGLRFWQEDSMISVNMVKCFYFVVNTDENYLPPLGRGTDD